MSVIAKAKVLKVSGKKAFVQIMDRNGCLTGERRQVHLKDNVKVAKGNTVLISFGVIVDRVGK